MGFCLGSPICWSIFAVLLTFVFLYVKHLYSYWKRRGVNSLRTKFPFGNFKDAILQKTSLSLLVGQLYKESKDAVIGVYVALQPILILRDTEIIRTVMVKDFQYFHDRGVYCDESIDPLSGHLFALGGQKWKNLRMRLTPAFTSGKLKAMFSTLVDCGLPLQNYMANIAKDNKPFDVRDLAANYTTNAIASIGFGVDINCIDEPNTDFRIYGKKIFQRTTRGGLVTFLQFVYPAILKYLRVRVVNREVEKFMVGMVAETLNYREKSGVARKDFFQLLVQLRNTGSVQLDDQWETKTTVDENKKTLTLEEVTAQAYIFFLAGFETSSTTMSFCLFEIAKNPKVQAKVHEEIDHVLAKCGGNITYESVSEMKYLENCIDETLRKYPPVPILNRICTKEYNIPGTDITIEKDTSIIIPVMALHKDPQYYPNPEEFIPERFNAENQTDRTFVNRPYLPFGDGPRVCIGLRLGKIQTKIGLVLMLQRHCYELAPRHIGRDIEFNPRAFLLAPKDGLELLGRSR